MILTRDLDNFLFLSAITTIPKNRPWRRNILTGPITNYIVEDLEPQEAAGVSGLIGYYTFIPFIEMRPYRPCCNRTGTLYIFTREESVPWYAVNTALMGRSVVKIESSR
jgi:hypothetical protein